MNSRPLVSCIIIFLNAEKYIEEAIASILAQTYEHWELLLVDDGSTDGSTAIAQRYAQQYPGKVRYLEHEGHQNRGMSASRNLGIRHAQGEYIGFLDADDLWLPEKLAQQVAVFQAHPEARMVYGRTQIWYSWSGNPDDEKLNHFYDLGVPPNTLIQPPQLLIQLLHNQAQTPTTCNALMHRSVFDEVGGFEESFRAMYEDQVFFSKIHLRFPVFVAGECWAKYRQHQESCSSVSEKLFSYYANRIPFLKWLEHYLAQQRAIEPSVRQTLNTELFFCQYPMVHQLLIQVQTLTARLIWKAKSGVRSVLPKSIVSGLQREKSSVRSSVL